MGFYINVTSKGVPLDSHDKANDLIKDGAVRLPEPPKTFQPNLVCVVENGLFDAAAYAHSEREMEYFMHPGDTRTKTWLVYEHASWLSGYDEFVQNL